MNINDLVQQIDSGALDAHFAHIRETMRQREKLVELRKLHQLADGQTVWLTDHVTPTYLIGLEATIVEINRARAVIRLKKGGVGRFRGDSITVYPQHITPVKPQYAR